MDTQDVTENYKAPLLEAGSFDRGAKPRVLSLERDEAFLQGTESGLQLFCRVPRGDVLRAIPIEALDVYEDGALRNVLRISGAEALDERG